MILHNNSVADVRSKDNLEMMRNEINGLQRIIDDRPHHPKVHQICDYILMLEEKYKKITNSYYLPYA